MLAVVWITETNCAQTAEYARDAIPSEAEVTLVHVSPSDVEDLVGEGADGLLGRRPAPAPVPSVRAIAAEQAQELLEAARARLARTAEMRALRGHPSASCCVHAPTPTCSCSHAIESAGSVPRASLGRAGSWSTMPPAQCFSFGHSSRRGRRP